jgi:hypothetical protein
MTVNQRKIGYARVSTDDQNLDLQRDALTKAGCTEIYEEKVSGKSAERVELDHCLRALRPGDALTVWRLDRLGRSLPDLVRIVGNLENRNWQCRGQAGVSRVCGASRVRTQPDPRKDARWTNSGTFQGAHGWSQAQARYQANP